MNPDTEVVIYRDHVVVFGQRINRPSRVSVMQWLQLWESLKHQEREK